ncbi:MAG: cyclic nucleotide-binding domain-containing protein [Chloroflexi bacterium]|nr:cyclic nucleotide-binding domain-containing protein [Chloroflexota bacterium]
MTTDAFDPRTLAALPVFQGLSATEIAEIERISSVASYPPGSTIFWENQPGDALYAVLQGRVEVRIQDRHGSNHTIATLGPGAVLGEMALFTDDIRSATAVAVTETTVLRLPTAAFVALLQQGRRAASLVVYNLGQVAARRLREVNRRLVAVLADQEEAAAPRRLDELTDLKRKLFEWKF